VGASWPVGAMVLGTICPTSCLGVCSCSGCPGLRASWVVPCTRWSRPRGTIAPGAVVPQFAARTAHAARTREGERDGWEIEPSPTSTCPGLGLLYPHSGVRARPAARAAWPRACQSGRVRDSVPAPTRHATVADHGRGGGASVTPSAPWACPGAWRASPVFGPVSVPRLGVNYSENRAISALAQRDWRCGPAPRSSLKPPGQA
jgi:hypothetical protein